MKIAIPTRGSVVDNHFGHCEFYSIVTVLNDNKIESFETFEAPVGCGCKSNIASTLANMGVDTMLAGNMGQGAVNKLTSAGIKVVRGCSGDVKQLAEAYLRDDVEDSGETCHSHDGDGEHQCSH